jgi:protein SCO1/2
MRSLRITLWGVVAVFAALLAYLYWNGQTANKTAGLDIGMPFTLASSKGGTVSSDSLKGTPYAMFFGFTHCPVICPTTLYEMDAAFKALGDDGKDLRMFFVSVDPERDTQAFLANYIANFDPRIEGLIPTTEELPALAKAFRVFYRKVPSSDGSYTMDHTATVFLFDRNGEFAGTLAFDEDPKMRVAKLKRLTEK